MSDSDERAGHGAIPEIRSVLATSDENSRLSEFLKVCRVSIEDAAARGEYGHDMRFQWEGDQVVAISRLAVLLRECGYRADINRGPRTTGDQYGPSVLSVSWGDGDQRVNQQTTRMS